MIRAVLDTNLLISGTLWGGLPGRVYDAATDRRYILLSTKNLLGEFSDVLQYPKLAPRIAARQVIPERLVERIRTLAVIVEPADIPPDAVRDPKDRIVLACAVGGKADCIVSGDNDLLVLNIFRSIPILTAERFLARLAEQLPGTKTAPSAS